MPDSVIQTIKIIQTRMERAKYENGYRYCSHCSFFFKTNRLRCPICGKIMRAAARRRKWKSYKVIDPDKYLKPNGGENP